MSLQTDIAKSHLETLIENLTGVVKAAPDIEGDYAVRLNGATFWARIDGNDQPICRVYAIISDQVVKSAELLDALNSINSRLIFLRALWVNGQILMEGNFLALTMDVEDFETPSATASLKNLEGNLVSRNRKTTVICRSVKDPDHFIYKG